MKQYTTGEVEATRRSIPEACMKFESPKCSNVLMAQPTYQRTGNADAIAEAKPDAWIIPLAYFN